MEDIREGAPAIYRGWPVMVVKIDSSRAVARICYEELGKEEEVPLAVLTAFKRPYRNRSWPS